MKYLFTLCIYLFSTFFLFGQNNTIHKVKKGETLYRISKLYNVSVDDLLTANKMDLTSVIKPDMDLIIPKPSNATAKTKLPVTVSLLKTDTLTKNAKEPVVKKDTASNPKKILLPAKEKTIKSEETSTFSTNPILKEKTYTVQPGDNLYKIARENNSQVSTLIALNNLTSTNVHPGQKLIIVPKNEDLSPQESISPKAKMPKIEKAAVAKTTVQPKSPAPLKDSLVVEKQQKTPAPITPVAKKIIDEKEKPLKSLVNKNEKRIIDSNMSILNEKTKDGLTNTSKPDTAVKSINPLPDTISKKESKDKLTDSTLKKVQEETKGIITKAIDSNTFNKQNIDSSLLKIKNHGLEMLNKQPDSSKPVKEKKLFDLDNKPLLSNDKHVREEGFFAAYYDYKSPHANIIKGDAATFKSGIGIDESKYYILINNIEKGTIVRVICGSKAICAKVAGPMPVIKENSGLLARLSSAAEMALGQTAVYPVQIEF